ncbi:hypothetical protein MC60_020560 [Aeromonas caviae]|nr:hypothetical protein MC60_020560 [Aeromonas caviae]
MGAPMKQGDERDSVNPSQASSVGANLAPECGGNIRGSKKECQRQELASLAPQGRRHRPGGGRKKRPPEAA